ncbi:MAG TPA: hypothetical protein VM223_03980 [Planctomycetota bacterium]|nr:hypothetical protein [Planctomycetota bacterium]
MCAEVEAPLEDDGSLTFCLLLADDLGNDPQLLDTPLDDWMSPPVREVNREIRATKVQKPSPAGTIEAMRGWIAAHGYAGLRQKHQAAWKAVVPLS